MPDFLFFQDDPIFPLEDNFLDCWNFFTTADPTHGYVQYVSEEEAKDLNLFRITSASSVYLGNLEQVWLRSGRRFLRFCNPRFDGQHSFSEKHRSNTVDWLRVSYESYVYEMTYIYTYYFEFVYAYIYNIYIYIYVYIYIHMCVWFSNVSTEHQPIATTVDLDHATLIRKWWSHDMAKGRCILPWQTWNSAEEAWWDKMHQWNRFDCNPITDFQKAGSLPSGMFPAR